MTPDEMKQGYSKMGTKLLVTKLNAAQDAQEYDIIANLLTERGVNADGSPMKKEAVVVEISAETAEEIAEAEAAAAAWAAKDPSTMTAAEAKVYAKEKAAKEREARKALIKAENQGQRAELNQDLIREQKAAAKVKREAEKLAKRQAKKEVGIEKKKLKMQDASPHGVAVLGKRVGFYKFLNFNGSAEDVTYGIAVGLVLDKRVNMMLIRIQGEDGKTYHKVDTSKELYLADEAGVLTAREGLPDVISRASRALTPEDAAAKLAEAEAKLEARREAQMAMSPYGAPLLGKRVAFKSFFSGQPTFGKAVSLIKDKRVNKVLVRIQGEDGHIYHKVDTSYELYEANEAGELIARELPAPVARAIKVKIVEAPVEAPAEAPASTEPATEAESMM